jgi:hypothetical protein
MVVVALKVPIPLATNSDFKVIYYTTQGLIHGVDVYDHTAKIGMINEIYGTEIDETFIPQFAYPPWYALSTFYLGLFPIQQAAVLWFEINLAMLFLSVYFLTDGWKKPILRLLAFPTALFFYPVLGTLAIGQYDLPVLLGASMLIYAFHHKNAALTALGMALLTFKPHLGGLILLAGLVYIYFQPGRFGKKAWAFTIYTGCILFLIGFLADISWPPHYLNSLFSYRDLGHITTCSECVNISVWLSRSISGELSLSQAGAIASLIFAALFFILYAVRAKLFHSPSLSIASALMVTLLASPYLYNYDFILLLVPFALLLNSPIEKISTALCYLGSTFALIVYGREGNNALLIVSVIVAVLLYLRIQQVDVPASASYNINN